MPDDSRRFIGGQYNPKSPTEQQVIEAFDQIAMETQWDGKTIVAHAIIELAKSRGYAADMVIAPTLLDARLSDLLTKVIHATNMLTSTIEGVEQ